MEIIIKKIKLIHKDKNNHKSKLHFFAEGKDVYKELECEILEEHDTKPYKFYRSIFPLVIKKLEKQNLNCKIFFSKTKWAWSQNAGCSCGCSPGFKSGSAGNDYDFYVTFTTSAAIERERKLKLESLRQLREDEEIGLVGFGREYIGCAK